jgi:hypothetical protein
MFVGHLAVAFAGARVDRSVSAGWFVASATLLDLLWPPFLLAGFEHVRIVPGATAFTPLVFESYPWSHSLLMVILWGALLAAAARWRGIGVRAAAVMGVLVVSHWVLDFVTHAPDMPLWPGASPRLGLGLWYSIPATFAVEGPLWVAGLAFYLRGRRARTWRGPIALGSFVAVCTLMWILGPYAAPPPSERALAWFALIGWIVVPWVAWADRGFEGAKVRGSRGLTFEKE